MEQRARKVVAAAATMSLILTSVVTTGAERQMLGVVVYVSDQTGIERALLAEAQAQTDRIFKDVGVRLAWREVTDESYRPQCDPFSVLVTLLSPAMVEEASRRGGRSGASLGSAADAAGRAFIHPVRIQALASRTRGLTGELMGRVMAHEIGHLLLPAGHSHYGIMTAGMHTDPSVSARFTVSEAKAIRRLVEARSAAFVRRTDCGN